MSEVEWENPPDEWYESEKEYDTFQQGFEAGMEAGRLEALYESDVPVGGTTDEL